MHVPQGMEQWYGKDVYLLLHKTLYGLKQAAYRFWMYLLKIVRGLKFNRSKADPCLYFRWADTNALLLWFSWVDDCFITGSQKELIRMKKEIMDQMECDDRGEITEFCRMQNRLQQGGEKIACHAASTTSEFY
jgi:hypothetical protein